MINWKVRLKNPNFWMSFVPAVLLVVQAAASALGLTVELAGMQEKILGILNAVFALLSVLGIVNDPTTKGLHDSELAMGYEVPKG